MLFCRCGRQILPVRQIDHPLQPRFIHGKHQHAAVCLLLPHRQGGQHRHAGALRHHPLYGLGILQPRHDAEISGVIARARHVLLQRPVGAGALLAGNGRLAQQLPPPDAPPLQRLVRRRVGRDHHQLVLQQRVVHHALGLRAGAHKAQTHLPVLQQPVDLGGVAVAQLIAGLRVPLDKGGHQLRQHILPRHGGGAQHQRQGGEPVRIRRRFRQGLALGQDFFGQRVQPLAVLRQRHAALPPSQQQRHAQNLLQRAQMGAGSGLGQVQQLGGASQAFLLRRRRKHLQLPQRILDHGWFPPLILLVILYKNRYLLSR